MRNKRREVLERLWYQVITVNQALQELDALELTWLEETGNALEKALMELEYERDMKKSWRQLAIDRKELFREMKEHINSGDTKKEEK